MDVSRVRPPLCACVRASPRQLEEEQFRQVCERVTLIAEFERDIMSLAFGWSKL